MAILFEPQAQLKKLAFGISKMYDFHEGRSAIEANWQTYYQGLELDTTEQSIARVSRGLCPIYLPNIILSFVSSVFRKKPNHVFPVEEKDLLVSNVDLLGNTINDMSEKITRGTLTYGFCGSLVDFNDKAGRPYIKFISAEKIVSIRTTDEKGYPELSQFIYTEFEEVQDEINEFVTKNVKVHYVWDLSEGTARVRKYTRQAVQEELTNNQKVKDKTEQEDILVSTTEMIINGKALTKLPIVIHGKNSNNFTVEKSIMQGILDLNISLIQRDIDRVEVLYLTAMPTPWITGVDPTDPDAPKTIGSSRIWFLPDGSEVGLLEFEGSAYESHEKIIEEIKESMAVLGAQILKQGGLSRETATSVLVRVGNETAVITSIVQNVSSQIEELLKIYFEWAKETTDDLSYELNADFLNVDMDPNAQIALVKSWLDGAISKPSLFKKFKEGELIPSDRTFEEEEGLIKKYPPTFPGKEKDKEIAESSETSENEEVIKGSNMETGNGLKNPLQK